MEIKTKPAFSVLAVLILIQGGRLQNWVSKILSFYLEQTTHLGKFLSFFCFSWHWHRGSDLSQSTMSQRLPLCVSNWDSFSGGSNQSSWDWKLTASAQFPLLRYVRQPLSVCSYRLLTNGPTLTVYLIDIFLFFFWSSAQTIVFP